MADLITGPIRKCDATLSQQSISMPYGHKQRWFDVRTVRGITQRIGTIGGKPATLFVGTVRWRHEDRMVWVYDFEGVNPIDFSWSMDEMPGCFEG